jgi:hypothetical protein
MNIEQESSSRLGLLRTFALLLLIVIDEGDGLLESHLLDMINQVMILAPGGLRMSISFCNSILPSNISVDIDKPA